MFGESLALIVILVLEVVGASTCPDIISREKWGAKEPSAPNLVTADPFTYVIIHHSRTPKCKRQKDCEVMVKSIQKRHMKYLGWNDIGYNFLIGEDGNVYEGIGWDTQTTDMTSREEKSIHISLMGDYTSWLPSTEALNAVKELIRCGISRGSIKTQYRLIGHRQIENRDCPGMKLYQEIRHWPHWRSY